MKLALCKADGKGVGTVIKVERGEIVGHSLKVLGRASLFGWLIGIGGGCRSCPNTFNFREEGLVSFYPCKIPDMLSGTGSWVGNVICGQGKEILVRACCQLGGGKGTRS